MPRLRSVRIAVVQRMSQKDVRLLDHDSPLPEEADGQHDDEEQDEADWKDKVAVRRMRIRDGDRLVSHRLVAVFALLVSRVFAIAVPVTHEIRVNALFSIFWTTDKFIQTAAQLV